MAKAEKVIGFTSLWIARLALAVLAFAGLMHFLAPVDTVLAYPIAGLGVSFLLKETL